VKHELTLIAALTVDADGDEQITELQQQLLATQEAYQRVREALLVAVEYLPATGDAIVESDLGHIARALSNPPSIEALEHKKLEGEIAVLDEFGNAAGHGSKTLLNMIAERKDKLEKMK